MQGRYLAGVGAQCLKLLLPTENRISELRFGGKLMSLTKGRAMGQPWECSRMPYKNKELLP